jgi:hypothetical protein
MRNLLWMIVALGTTFIRPAPSHAFDANGYSDGMAFDAVATRVTASGYRLQAMRSGQANATYYYAVRGVPPGAVEVGDTFWFCDNRLTFYSTPIGGGFPAFVRLVDQTERSFGVGSAESQVAETQLGPFYTLKLSWRLPMWVESVDITQINQQSLDVSHSFKQPRPECS